MKFYCDTHGTDMKRVKTIYICDLCMKERAGENKITKLVKDNVRLEQSFCEMNQTSENHWRDAERYRKVLEEIVTKAKDGSCDAFEYAEWVLQFAENALTEWRFSV